MAGNEKLPAVSAFGDGDAGFVGICHQLQFRYGLHLLPQYFRRSGMRGVENIVEPAKQRGIFLYDPVGIDTGQFWDVVALLYAVMVIKARERTPARMKRSVHMRLCPFHNAL